MLKVNYEKSEVIKTWLSTPVSRRKELLTYKDTSLITLVNCINTSLVLAANEGIRGSFEILESIDTYWTEPIYMQIKPSLVKGLKLVNLLQKKFFGFLIGKKKLILDSSQYGKIFEFEIKTWENFQVSICGLIEQAFLTSHYCKLKNNSDKAALDILELKLTDAPKIKQKRKSGNKIRKYEPWNREKEVGIRKEREKDKGIEVKKVKELEIKKERQKEIEIEIKEEAELELDKEKDKDKEKLEDWFDAKDFLIEISSDKSTDIDDKESLDLMWFSLNTLGGRSHALRKFYANVALEWDFEVSQILNQAYFESHPFEYLPNYPVVRYYEHPSSKFLHSHH